MIGAGNIGTVIILMIDADNIDTVILMIGADNIGVVSATGIQS